MTSSGHLFTENPRDVLLICRSVHGSLFEGEQMAINLGGNTIYAPNKGPAHKLVRDTYVHVLTHREALRVDESPTQDTTPQNQSNAT